MGKATKMNSVLKLLLVIVSIIIIAFLGQYFFDSFYSFPKQIDYGVSFSPQYAQYLGLDWEKTFIEIIDELKIKNLRLPTYWSSLEPEKYLFNFSDTDFMLDLADKKGAKVILVLGARQPRWPECHLPNWVSKLDLPSRQNETLKFITAVLERYKDRKSIWAFQVENEPFLPFFGENCDKGDVNFLKKEVELVKKMSGKPVIISDSGELGSWIVPMQLSDIFGTTLYKEVYNPVMGYISYPILPYFYNLKSQIIKRIFAPQNQKTIIVELQSEPWLFSKDLKDDTDQQSQLFPVEKLKSYIEYAQKTGFDEVYLWGVEWWYWMAQNGHPEYLEFAKTLFK